MPNNTPAQLPADLPWNSPAYLLLDGISVDTLAQRLYQWSAAPDFDVLYLDTPWADLADVSPCLIHLSGAHDSILGAFLENSAHEWGYLLFSNASRAALLNHLRWLACVQYPLGTDMLLRLADPAVIHALLQQAEQDNDSTLFGPIDLAVTPDHIQDCWHQHHRAGPAQTTTPKTRYRLTEPQLERLGDVSFRSLIIRLDAHLHDFFPDYQPTLSSTERWQHLHALADQAYAQGFHSEHEITLYSNIFALLGPAALDTHRDIAALVSQPSSLSPSQRIEQAADIAYARASSAERTPHDS